MNLHNNRDIKVDDWLPAGAGSIQTANQHTYLLKKGEGISPTLERKREHLLWTEIERTYLGAKKKQYFP